ncbi:hypothetical protein RUM43_015071 [Polyplax serrata]|uniref:Uncharacterized protein n=1 Tax=Polyplax serrata TaxID=468196 RepID=A0AAN8P0P0_POLSC
MAARHDNEAPVLPENRIQPAGRRAHERHRRGRPGQGAKAGNQDRFRSKINTICRLELLACTRCFGTVSYDALFVISGVLPIGLYIKARRTEGDKKRAMEAALDQWQLEWQAGKGAHTRSIWPDVRERLACIDLRGDSY